MTTYAFVFARGGSKGLPGKNVRLLDGKPLVTWAIDIARSIPEIEKVFVSTDDETISRLASESDAIVIDRPRELATDTAPEWLAWQHAVSWVKRAVGDFDRFVSLPATAPLRTVGDVEAAIAALDDNTDAVVTMSKSQKSPWFNMVITETDGRLRTVIESGRLIARRQDAPTTFDLATVAYVAKPGFLLQATSLWDGRVIGVEVSRRSAVDIDTIEDFRFAEFLLRDEATE